MPRQELHFDSSEEEDRRYVIRESGQYEVDRDAAFLRRLSRDPEFAGRWLKRLGEVVDDLGEFPGPLSHAKDEAASALFGREVRPSSIMVRHGGARAFPPAFYLLSCHPPLMSLPKRRRQSFSCFV